MRIKDLRDRSGLVTQETPCFDDTISITSATACPTPAESKSSRLQNKPMPTDSSKMNFAGLRNNGRHTGQQTVGRAAQRIALARAILRDSVDPDPGRGHQPGRLGKANRPFKRCWKSFVLNRTVIIITHRLAILPWPTGLWSSRTGGSWTWASMKSCLPIGPLSPPLPNPLRRFAADCLKNSHPLSAFRKVHKPSVRGVCFPAF